MQLNKSDEVSNCVLRALSRITPDNPETTKILAKLRRGVGKSIDDSPETWEYVISVMPSELLDNSKNGAIPTEAESAVYVALTLYALHQQSKSQNMNQSGVSFGEAVRKLMMPDNKDSITRRFNAIITASDSTELAYHARGLIQLMRSSDSPIGMDYPMFAKDLYNYQFPDGKKRVILRWGQNFYKVNKEKEE